MCGVNGLKKSERGKRNIGTARIESPLELRGTGLLKSVAKTWTARPPRPRRLHLCQAPLGPPAMLLRRDT